VAALHAAGLKVVCYLDVGSYEPGRPDSADYPAALKLSEDPDWPSEWFLDTRDVFKSGSVLASILSKRFQMCKDKGFDAVEPDNLDNWDANRNILTEQDQVGPRTTPLLNQPLYERHETRLNVLEVLAAFDAAR